MHTGFFLFCFFWSLFYMNRIKMHAHTHISASDFIQHYYLMEILQSQLVYLTILFNGCIMSHDVDITIYSAILTLMGQVFISRLFSFLVEVRGH